VCILGVCFDAELLKMMMNLFAGISSLFKRSPQPRGNDDVPSRTLFKVFRVKSPTETPATANPTTLSHRDL